MKNNNEYKKSCEPESNNVKSGIFITEEQVNTILEKLGKIPLKDSIELFNYIHQLWNEQH